MDVKGSVGSWSSRYVGLCLIGFLSFSLEGQAQQPPQRLHNHVPQAVANGKAALVGHLAPTKALQLTVVLPLRNQSELTNLLNQLYDPASPLYRHFLTVQQFTDEFGPTAQDYQAVIAYFKSNGFTIRNMSRNRLVLDISGTTAQVEATFNVSMNIYRDPNRNRTFFSPDREPTLNLSVPIKHISGLDNFSLPVPMMKVTKNTGAIANVTGSGPGGSYLGSDMRAAYYGGTLLTGAGQCVGLLEFQGYRISDVNLTFNNAGLMYSVPINNVLIDGGDPDVPPGSDDAEQVLDIAQAIGMAPGLSQVRVYIAQTSGQAGDIFNSMATEDICKQLSVSWGWSTPDATTYDGIFQEFAAQGQSLFVASGDDGAYDPTINSDFAPADDDNVTVVGGTHLTTNYGGGPWVAESAWNNPPYGSGGGISPDGVPIPTWQQGIGGGSNTLRNLPDVAMEADLDNYYCNMGTCQGGAGGTSFAAPRWAGFMALVNQQAVEAGTAPHGGIGFLNPSIYSIGQGANYSLDFHDITSGNNDSDGQPIWYNAFTGYDLVTGWGSPNGQNLIDALAGTVIPGFWITSAPTSLSLYQGTSGTATISVTDAGGFAGSVNLSASGLPTGVTASFNPTSTPGTSELLLTADSSAAVGSASITITGTSGTLTASAQFMLTVNSPQTPPPPIGELGSVNLGASSSPTAVTMTFKTAGTLNNIAVLTQGSPGLDFSDAGGDTCAVGTAYAANATCTANIDFAPKYPGNRYGAVVLTDSGGNQLALGYLQGTGNGPQTTFNPGSETTIGNGFADPQDGAIRGDGSIYVTDSGNATVPGALYLENFSNGSYDQTQLNCTFKSPAGIAVDGSGTVYVADPGVPAVYKITISSGNCTQTAIGSGFVTPWGVTVDGSGNVYITDLGGQISNTIYPAAVYKEALQTDGAYVQSTIGSGWVSPSGVAIDNNGNIYIADHGIPGVFMESPSGGNYTQTPIGQGWTAPFGIAVDAVGEIYVSEAGNSLIEGGAVPADVYKEVLSSGNYIQTPIGIGWTAPSGLAVDATGNVVVADQLRGIYKEELADPPQLAFANTAENTSSNDSPRIVTVSNLGTAALDFSAVSYPADFPEAGTSPSDCTPSTLLNPAQSCTLSIDFLPTTSLGGNSSLRLNENVSITTNTLNIAETQQALSVGGTEVLPGGSVNLIVSANPSAAGNSVTFTATVAGTSGGPIPTGTVTFYNGATPLSGAISLTNAVATYSTASLAAGIYNVSASYSGDGNYSSSNSATITESIVAAPGTAPVGTTNLGNLNVGSTSGTIPLTFTFSQAETLGSIAVLTQGAANLDFANAGGGTCTTGTAYTLNSTCTVNVTFSPKYSGIRYGAVVLSDSSGNVIGSAYLEGAGTGPQTSFLPGTLTSLPGTFGYPQGIAVDGAGNLYIADPLDAAVYKETLVNGTYTQSTIGTGFNEPYGVALDGAGNVYVADSGNHVVYEETPSSGGYSQAVIGYGFSSPSGVAVDGLGNVYVTDYGNGVTPGAVYLETLSNGSYAQTQIQGTFVSPQGVAVDGNGNLFVTDSANGGASAAVYELTPSNGVYNQTSIGSGWVTPAGIAVDGNGNIFVADDAYDLGMGFIAMETPQPDGTFAQTIITNSSTLPDPAGIAIDGSGNRYITDNFQGAAYRQDIADPPSLSFAATVYDKTSPDSPETVIVQNVGNASLNFSAVSYATDFPEAPGIPTDCTSSTSLGAEATCTLSIGFTPASSTGSNQSILLSESVSITTNSLNAGSTPQSLAVSGTEAAPIATVNLTVPAQIATVGTSVTFTATVAGESGIPVPAGTVTFYSSGTELGASSLTNGTAAYSTSSLAIGSYTITASYSGDQNYPSAASNAINEQIIPASTFGTQPLGGSNSQSITVTFSSRVTLGSISVVTQGASNLDFTNAGGGTCTVGTKYTAGSTCTVMVSFKPLYSGTRYGALVLGDTSGNLIQAVPMEGTGTGAQLSFSPTTQKTVFTGYTGVAVDENGSIYIDTLNSTNTPYVAKLTPSGSGYASATIPTSSLTSAGEIAVDASGSLYITESYISKKQSVCSLLKETLVAGTYTQSTVFNGQACWSAMAVDTSGNIYLSYSSSTQQIVKETLSGGVYTQTTISSSALYGPSAMMVDGSGNLFVWENQGGSYYGQPFQNEILKFTPSGGGYAESTIVNSTQIPYTTPVIDGNGDLFFGSYSAAYTGTGGQILEAIPSGNGYTIVSKGNVNPCCSVVGIDGGQNLYVVGDSTSTITKIDSSDPPSIAFAATSVGATSSDSPRTVPIENVGNAALTVSVPETGTNPSVSSNFSLDSSTTCPQVNTAGSAGILNIGSSCNYNINFAPTTTGTINGSLVLSGNLLSGTETIPLSGNGNGGGAMFAMLTTGSGGAPQVVLVPKDSSLGIQDYGSVWTDTLHQTLILGGVFLVTNAQGQLTCDYYPQNSVVVSPRPQFGTPFVRTDNLTLPNGQCPGKLFPFQDVRYTWGPVKSVERDPFVLRFTTQNGIYENDYAVTARFANITVSPAVQSGTGSNPPLTATATLADPPTGADGFDWTIIGGGGSIVFPNGQESMSSSTNSINIQEPNPTGTSIPFNIQVGARYPTIIPAATPVVDSDALLYGPTPAVLSGPQVTFSSQQGIPLAGTVGIDASLKGTTTQPITISLSTTTGTGSAIITNGGNIAPDGLSTTITSSTKLTLKGVTVSSTARNIKLDATVPSGSGTSSVAVKPLELTVVAVSISAPQTSGSVTSDYPETANLPDTSLAPQVVPPNTPVTVGSNEYLCTAPYFVTATVTPSNYPGLVTLRRTITSGAWYQGTSNTPMGTFSNVDDTGSLRWNWNSPSDSSGKIYDWDDPAEQMYLGSTPTGTIRRLRENFNEYAVVGSTDSKVTVGNMIQIFSRSSCVMQSSGAAFDSTYFGDNTAGSGTTSISATLE